MFHFNLSTHINRSKSPRAVRIGIANQESVFGILWSKLFAVIDLKHKLVFGVHYKRMIVVPFWEMFGTPYPTVHEPTTCTVANSVC